MADEKSGKKGAGAGMNSNVRKMGTPIYKVQSGGVTVDWTDKYTEAAASYKDAVLPKEIWSVNGRAVSLVNSAH